MAKNIFQEEQRFKNWEVIFLLAFFMIGLTVRLIEQNWVNPIEEAINWMTFTVFMLPMAIGLWYLLTIRLTVRVTEKSISAKYSHWQKKRQKVKWEDVEDIELVKTPPIAQWSGGNISFNHEKKYSLCGRNGIYLKTKQGEEILIGARHFGEFRKALAHMFPKLANG